ncbi:unnamed protein product, partial [Ixodes hexagonus]
VLEPKSSLVYPAFVESRGLPGNRVLKINKDITLNLKKSSVLANEFLVRSYVGDVLKHTYLDGSYLEEDLFHDENAMASVSVSEDEGLQVEGMIGDKFRITPSLEQERASDGRIAHRLEMIVKSYEGLHNDYVLPEGPVLNITARAANNDIYNVKMIYPEIFLMVDTVFRRQFKSERKMLKYICRTFNAMNLRYLSVSNPKVKFRLMGVQTLTRTQESFLAIMSGLDNSINGVTSVYNLKDFVGNNSKAYGSYDLVYMITGRDMVVQIGSHIDNSNMGFAFVAAACGDRRVGLGEDKAESYMGVRVMTHEVGHIMGCPHDGDPGPPEFGGPGSQGCPFADGYLMSYNTDNLNQYRFSSCCNYLISLMSWSSLGKCLHKNNAKSSFKMKSNSLPGKGSSRSTQCKKGFPELPETYFMKNMPIVNCEMKCFIPARVYGYKTVLPLSLTDGTKCGVNNHV